MSRERALGAIAEASGIVHGMIADVPAEYLAALLAHPTVVLLTLNIAEVAATLAWTDRDFTASDDAQAVTLIQDLINGMAMGAETVYIGAEPEDQSARILGDDYDWMGYAAHLVSEVVRRKVPFLPQHAVIPCQVCVENSVASALDVKPSRS
jgi:hypothetical protein